MGRAHQPLLAHQADRKCFLTVTFTGECQDCAAWEAASAGGGRADFRIESQEYLSKALFSPIPSLRTKILSSWRKRSPSQLYNVCYSRCHYSLLKCSFYKFHFVLHIRPVVGIGRWLTRMFLFQRSNFHSTSLYYILQWRVNSDTQFMPYFHMQSSVVPSHTWMFILCPPPKLATGNRSPSPVRLLLAAALDNYLCCGHFFQFLRLTHFSLNC